MEDQDRETRIDEDVEAHANKGRNIHKDDTDVEGHVHLRQQKGQNKLANDEGDDDVEGHVHLRQQKGVNKL